MPYNYDNDVFCVYRSDYEDFLRDIAKQFTQHLPIRVDSYMASSVQVPVHNFCYNTISHIFLLTETKIMCAWINLLFCFMMIL